MVYDISWISGSTANKISYEIDNNSWEMVFSKLLVKKIEEKVSEDEEQNLHRKKRYNWRPYQDHDRLEIDPQD